MGTHQYALVATLLAAAISPGALARSAGDGVAALKDKLPDIAMRLIVSPGWDSSLKIDGEDAGEATMEAGFGMLATIGTGDKKSWHSELEMGYRTAKPQDAETGSLNTFTIAGNGYYGFEISGEIDGYLGAGVGLAWHRARGAKDLALALQAMIGIGYELTKDLRTRVGLRYFMTEDASFGTGAMSYARPEIEVGIEYEF